MTARTDRRVALIIGAALAALFTVCSAVQVASWSVGSVERTSHNVIPGPVRQLTVEARSGDVTLVPSQDGNVRIDSSATGTLHTPKLQVRPEGTVVSVSGGCPDITFGHCSAEIVIQVPDGTAVEIHADSGDIAASGFDGRVELNTASGDVVAHDLGGPSVTLNSASGDLAASGLRARTVNAHTDSGDVSLGFTTAPTNADAETSSGDVSILVPPGSETYQVSLETHSGDQSLGVRPDASATRHLSARTASGDANVDYE